LSKSAANETRLEEDVRQLRLTVSETENQLTGVELLRRALDGDNQRLKMVLTDKDAEIQARPDLTH